MGTRDCRQARAARGSAPQPGGERRPERESAARIATAVSQTRPVAATIIRVRVKPKARESSLTQMSDGTWLARVKSPPSEGEATQELIALVAEYFGCAKRSVWIKSGASGRSKLVCVGKGGE